MAAQGYPIIEIDADFGGTIGQVTGRFEIKKATVSENTRTGYLVDSAFSQVIGLLAEYLPVDDTARKGITIDVGGGQHIFEIEFEGLGEEDGQWGYSADTAVLDQATATGGDRVQKVQVLQRYINVAEVHSLSPARLIYGEWAPGGIMPRDHVPVYFEDPGLVSSREEAATFDGSTTLVETLDLSGQKYTGSEQTPD